MEEKFICSICHKEFRSLTGLNKHYRLTHHYSDAQLEKEYLKNHVIEHCPICGKPCKFISLQSGYFYTCGDKECGKKLKQVHTIENLQKKYGEEIINVSQIPEVREKLSKINRDNASDRLQKSHNTYLEKTGFDNPSKDPKVKEKIKNTNKDRYGKDYYSQTQEFKDRVIKTSVDKYGEDHYLKNKGVILKRKETLREKYRVDNIFQDEGIKKKIVNDLQNKYQDATITNISQVESIKDKKRQTLYNHYGKDHYQKTDIAKKRIRKKLIHKILSQDLEVIPLFNEDTFLPRGQYLWKCPICGYEFKWSLTSKYKPRCLKCNPKYFGTSKPEQDLYESLKVYGAINGYRDYYDGNHFYEIDIYFPEKKIGIEVDGIYWHSEKQGYDKNRVLEKNNYFINKGIKLYHFYDREIINNFNLVRAMVLNRIGVTQQKVYARQCNVQIIDNSIAKEFLNNNHLQGFHSSKIHYGLFFNEDLFSVLSVSKSRYNTKYEWEIIRYATKMGCVVVGGLGKLIHFFEKDKNPRSVLTYVDRRIGYGQGYQNIGFQFLYNSNPNYYYTQNYIDLESRLKYQKYKLEGILSTFDSSLTEWDNMQNNGYDRIWDLGNMVFAKNL